MDSFSISELQQFSGIKAHTIRMWEQRYNALRPNRSEGNTRYYDNTQLRRLLNIVSLMNGDHKVSELCSMTDPQINRLLASHINNSTLTTNSFDYFISQFISAGLEYDEVLFEKLFANAVLRFGLKETYIQVVHPMLIRIGMMWTSGGIPVSQEHFISNILRQKFFAAIDALPPSKNSKESWLLFLPENEFHEIGLLLSNYLIRSAGKKVFYLGNNVPFDSVIDTVKNIQATHLLLFLVHNDIPSQTQKYLNSLATACKEKKILISGNKKLISEIKLGKNMIAVQSVGELEKQL